MEVGFFRTHLVLLAIASLFIGLVQSAQLPFRVCEDSKQQQVVGVGLEEVQLVYNALRREYFSVYLQFDGDHSSVVGQRFDERGASVGEPIAIFPWRPSQPITQNKKQYPVVAHNNNTDNYLVAWEFDFNGDGNDWDVVARVVSGDGKPQGPGVFFLASSFGREDSPHLAFSPQDNSFVLVHEVEDKRSGHRGISAQRINETHTLGAPIVLNTSYSDREPFVAHHPPSNTFFLVWEWAQTNDNKSVIGAVQLSGTPIKANSATPSIVGSTIEIIGGQRTTAHDHDAQLVYSPADDVFLLTWEVDGDSGEKEVVCNLVTADAKSSNFRVIGNASHPYDRRPSAVYSHFSNQFFIAYESGPNAISTGIEGAAFTSKDLQWVADPFPVSQSLDREHAPVVALSTGCGDILAMWSSETSHRRSKPQKSELESVKKPAATFEEAATHKEARTTLAVNPSALRSKFSLGKRSGGSDEAVPHMYLPYDMPTKTSVYAESGPALRTSAASSLQAIRVCLPGRSSCGEAAPSPAPTPSRGGDDSSTVGIVLGLLSAAVVLAGLGVGGYVGWRRYGAQIREWWENRKAGYAVAGVWADESEFSISVDAFTGSDNTAEEGEELH